jgi:hypothetical protein
MAAADVKYTQAIPLGLYIALQPLLGWCNNALNSYLYLAEKQASLFSF